MTKANNAAAAAETQATAAAMPLFFNRPAAFDSERHAHAGIRQKPDLSFARACNSVPLNAIEFIEAAHYYPIVFSNEEQPVPVAVLGWENNPYVTDENLWQDNTYVPAYVRQYPFILSQAPNSDKLYLCVDEAATNFVAENAGNEKDVLPFYVEGEASDTTKRALEFTNAFYQHNRITRNFCDDLKKHHLLMPYNATMRVEGAERHLSNFLMIDENAFNALPDETFLEFRKKGWLAFVYLSLASAANWKRSVK